ncbi:MAG: NADH-quinone oxidoreductase subunit L [Polyangiaceae bacterium]|nr:NADH-quinone oxidoreductase subunit L [Polyangiaceae bacterium]
MDIFPTNDFTLLAVILSFPLIGAFVNGVFGKRLGKEAVTLMALSAIGVPFLASVATFSKLLDIRAVQHAAGAGSADHVEQGARLYWHAWDWLDLAWTGGETTLSVAFSVDGLSGIMALVVTGVGFLIHVYSTSYMADDPGYHRFFSYLNLFIFSMLVLILGDSLPVLFVGWEGVGLCSYLLIGFWFQDDANAAAGKKAFLVNRIGDFGLLVAMALLLRYTGSLSWEGIEANSGNLPNQILKVWQMPEVLAFSFLPDWLLLNEPTIATLIGLCLFLGCAGKSAQLPLYVWLPDAMAGPTPVSALIHAATMVTAGVYLVCRLSFLFVLSPATMFTIAMTGALTAVFAATIAFVQNDIKKVLAYSTVSQLGYMFLGVGVGAFTAGFFHVLTHAFFKACLFLGAGSVIHTMHSRIHDTDSSQDGRNMGGLRAYMPVTCVTFFVSCLAIAGVFPLSGFFSKDAILIGALTNTVSSSGGVHDAFVWPEWAGSVLFGMGLIGAVMTAFYMARLYIMIFEGDFKGWSIVAGWKEPEGHDHHDDHGDGDEPIDGPAPHESPNAMTAPLLVLAALAAVSGLLSAHDLGTHWLDHWLDPVFANALGNVVTDAEAGSMVPYIASAATFAGLGGAYFVYVMRGGDPARELAEKVPALHELIYDKWRIDELYDELFVATLETLAEVSIFLDKWVVDGIIARASAGVVAGAGSVLRLFQVGRVQAYAAAMVIGSVAFAGFFLLPHARVQLNGDLSNGQYELVASPGLGYQYSWDLDGDGEFAEDDFADKNTANIRLNTGKTVEVGLKVRNAFGLIRTVTIPLTRPDPSADETETAGVQGRATGQLADIEGRQR